MIHLDKFISEKLVINKNSKSKNIIIPAGNYSDKLDLPNNRVDFPVKIEIDHEYTDIYYYYEVVKSNNNWYYKFYNEDRKNTLTLSEKEMLLVFDDEKGIMANTKYGWRPIIWRK